MGIKEDGFFSIQIDCLPQNDKSYSIHEPLFDELKREFDIEELNPSRKERLFRLPLKEFDKFAIQYYGDKCFNWSSLRFHTGGSILDLFRKYRNYFERNHPLLFSRLISENQNWNWNSSTLKEFKEFVDFEKISKNESVEWSINLLEDFLELWNFDHLSHNPYLPWSDLLLEKFTDKWKWKPDISSNARGGDWANNYDASISTNQGILWDLALYEKYAHLLGHWYFASKAKFESQIIINYHELFDEKFKTSSNHIKYSDWRSSTDNILNALEVIVFNKNVVFSNKLLSFAFYKKVQVYVASKSWHDESLEFEESLLDAWIRLDKNFIKKIN